MVDELSLRIHVTTPCEQVGFARAGPSEAPWHRNGGVREWSGWVEAAGWGAVADPDPGREQVCGRRCRPGPDRGRTEAWNPRTSYLGPTLVSVSTGLLVRAGRGRSDMAQNPGAEFLGTAFHQLLSPTSQKLTSEAIP